MNDWALHLGRLAENHPCSGHPLFHTLARLTPNAGQIAALLRNYDAHASVLRRLLLKAAAIMPEEACTYVLENVRNEYGNGNPGDRHQLQLLDLARQAGVTDGQLKRVVTQAGTRSYIKQVVPFYCPPAGCGSGRRFRPAVAAGAITATEILAIREFVAMQSAFARVGLAHHVWFDHVSTEQAHSGDSLALALHFVERYDAGDAVLYGLTGVLDANFSLYDGLLAALAGAAEPEPVEPVPALPGV